MCRNLFICWIDEPKKLDFHYRNQPVQRHADSCPDKSGFTQRRVDDAMLSKCFLQSVRRPKNAAIDTDIFPEQQNVVVLSQHYFHSVIYCLNDVEGLLFLTFCFRPSIFHHHHDELLFPSNVSFYSLIVHGGYSYT